MSQPRPPTHTEASAPAPAGIWRHVFWYSAIGFLRPAIQVLLIPLYLVKIPPDQYGILAAVMIFSALVSSVAGLKLDLALKSHYYDFAPQSQARQDYVRQLFSLMILLAVLAFGGFCAVGPWLFERIFSAEEIRFYPLGLLAVSIVLLASINSTYFTLLKNRMEVKTFVVLNAMYLLLNVGLQATLVLVFDLGIFGILLGGLIAGACTTLLILLWQRTLLTVRFQRHLLAPSLLFGFGFLPVSLLAVAEKYLDRYLLEHHLGLQEFGVYALTMNLVQLSTLLVMAYQQAVRPRLYQSLAEASGVCVRWINDLGITHTGLGLLVGLGVLLGSGLLPLLLSNPAYHGLVDLLPHALIACCPIVIIQFQILILLFHKRTALLSLSMVAKFLVSLLLMLWLIPEHGITGALIGLAISSWLYVLLGMLLLRHAGDTRLKIRSSVLSVAGFSAICVIYVMLRDVQGTAVATAATACLAVVPAWLVFQGPVRRIQEHSTRR